MIVQENGHEAFKLIFRHLWVGCMQRTHRKVIVLVVVKHLSSVQSVAAEVHAVKQLVLMELFSHSLGF
jgi:hypothetical protein